MEITYKKYLRSNPHFTLKNFSYLIKKSIEGNTAYRAKDIELGDILYTAEFDSRTMKLTLTWEEDGENFKRVIRVIKEKSNLPTLSGSYVYYFLCPRLGLKCRIIYRIGSFFLSRRAFDAVYPNQMESHFNRRIAYREAPYKKNGKEYYRGKITPYGIRCRRYEEREQAMGALLLENFQQKGYTLRNTRNNK